MQEMQETWVQSLGQEDPLEVDMATHSGILAWKTPWTGQRSLAGYRPQSLKESDTTVQTHTHTHTHTHNNYVFNILKNCPIVFQGYCNILYSEQQIMKIPISPHPHQHLFFLFIVAIGVSVNYFIVVLICIS